MYIVAPEERAVVQALEAEEKQAVAWLYLGERVRSFESCERWFAGRGTRIEFGAVLQEVAQARKQAYIDYVGQLGARFDSPQWWLGALSEKNPYNSKVYLHVCHILTAIRLVQKNAGEVPIVIVADNHSVRQILASHLAARGAHVIHTPEPLAGVIYARLRMILSWLIRCLWFVLHHGSRLAMARLLVARQRVVWGGSLPPAGKGLVLLHGWVDERCFDEHGRFCNINLGNLAQYLESRGWTYCLVPMILPDVPYAHMVRILLRSKTALLLPHAWLTASDLWRALAADLGWEQAHRDWPPFEDLDIGPLIEDEIRRDWMVARTPTNMLNALLVSRWQRHSLPIAGFVYSYENHRWERAFCLGFRRYYPDTCLIGYQDANVPDLCLNFFVATSEFKQLPFPDVVITNGYYSFDVLRQSGYPKERLRQGGAVRFEPSVRLAYHLDEAQGLGTDAETIPRMVLVVTPYSQELAAELIWKTVKALGAETGLRVVIKCHPVFPFSYILRALGDPTFPPHFQLSDRPFLELLRESGVLLYMDSTTSLEALAHGVAIIHVGSDWSLDLDTIGLPCEERVKARDPAEITAAVREIFGMDPLQRAGRRRKGRELVKTFFGPVGEPAYTPVAEALATVNKAPVYHEQA